MPSHVKLEARENNLYTNDKTENIFRNRKLASKSFTGLAVKDLAEVTKLFFKVGKGVLNDD